MSDACDWRERSDPRVACCTRLATRGLLPASARLRLATRGSPRARDPSVVAARGVRCCRYMLEAVPSIEHRRLSRTHTHAHDDVTGSEEQEEAGRNAESMATTATAEGGMLGRKQLDRGNLESGTLVCRLSSDLIHTQTHSAAAQTHSLLSITCLSLSLCTFLDPFSRLWCVTLWIKVVVVRGALLSPLLLISCRESYIR